MKLKLLIIFMILAGLGVGGFFVYKNTTAPKVEKGVVPAPSTEVRIYKGTWTPTLLTQDTKKLASDMQKMKEMGMNTVFFQGSPPQMEICLMSIPSDSKLAKKIKKVIPIQEDLLISNIQTAHKNGLKVALTMAKCMPGKKGEKDLDKLIDLEAWNLKIIELAKIAEKHEVEFFAPMNEPETLFGPSASATWGQEILPRIKEVYHGEIIWKGGGIGGIQPYPMSKPAPTNYSGYDYLGFTLGVGSGTTLEQLPQHADYALDTFLKYAERDGCKGVMISEFYGNTPDSWEEREWNEEKEEMTNEIVLEKGSKYDKVVGFFALDFIGLGFLGDDIPRMPDPQRSSKTEEVIRRWFTEIL